MTTTDLDLQRRCAELAGWSNIRSPLIGRHPQGGIDRVPDYLHDMNALRELIEVAVANKVGGSLVAHINHHLGNTKLPTYEYELSLLLIDPAIICRAFVEVMSDG